MSRPRPESFRLLGLHFSIGIGSDPTEAVVALTRLASHVFAPFATDDRAPAGYVVAASEGGPAMSLRFVGPDVDEHVVEASPRAVYSRLLWDVNRRVAEASGTRWLLLHGAAAARDGSAVVLSAPSESGKSTLVTALVDAGFDYVTDEFVAVDPERLLIQPVTKAIALDSGSFSLFPELAGLLGPRAQEFSPGQWQVRVQDWRPGQVQGSGVQPRVVVFPAYREGATVEVEPVGRAEALMALASQTFEWLTDPRLHLRRLAALMPQLACYRLVHGRLADAVAAVAELLDRQSQRQPDRLVREGAVQ